MSSIRASGILNGKINEKATLSGILSKPSGYTDYMGEYEVIPKVNEQTLYTKDKRMIDDVEIKGIPIYSTSNNSGGNTVYIAKEVV